MKVKYCIELVALTVALGVALIGSAACMTYETAVQQSAPWPTAQKLGPTAIGFFRYRGDSARRTRDNLYGSLAFALQERGFGVLEAAQTRALLKGAALSTARILDPNEIAIVRNRLPGRILLQGELQEVTTSTLLEDHIQVMLTVFVYDAWAGKRIATVKLFASDLDFHTGRETLTMARRVAEKIKGLGKVKSSGRSASRAVTPFASANCNSCETGSDLAIRPGSGKLVE